MSDIQANYLIHTTPEIKGPFLKILKKIFHFSRLSDDHLNQLFQYSNFVVLADGDRPVKEGTYGQNIFLLIQGRLEVFITNEEGSEEYVDVIYTPFRIFGEQCILGEPNTVSVEARGEVLLLGIDISGLPDLQDGLENPDNRLEDNEYLQNRDMYMIFADVLNKRLNRLVKDQYKLIQKIVILHQSQEYQASWKQNILLSTVFNEFSQNTLSPGLDVNETLRSVFEWHVPDSKTLLSLLEENPVDTRKIYLEMVRLDALGGLESMSSLLMEIIQVLSAKAMELEEYTGSLQLQSHNLPAIIPLSEYLNELHETITTTGILKKELNKEQFLKGFLTGLHPDAIALNVYLTQGGWVDSTFNMAHLMFLICRSCICKEHELNQIISSCVTYLKNISVPRQNTQTTRQDDQETNKTVVSEIIDLHRTFIGNGEKQVKERPSSSSGQTNVEDLLSEFGL